MFKAIREPLARPIPIKCHRLTTSAKSSAAKIRVIVALPACDKMTIRLRGMRSANAPAISETTVRGAAKDTIVHIRANGESSVICNTSHARTVMFMFMAMNEARVPSQSHL